MVKKYFCGPFLHSFIVNKVKINHSYESKFIFDIKVEAYKTTKVKICYILPLVISKIYSLLCKLKKSTDKFQVIKRIMQCFTCVIAEKKAANTSRQSEAKDVRLLPCQMEAFFELSLVCLVDASLHHLCTTNYKTNRI